MGRAASEDARVRSGRSPRRPRPEPVQADARLLGAAWADPDARRTAFMVPAPAPLYGIEGDGVLWSNRSSTPQVTR